MSNVSGAISQCRIFQSLQPNATIALRVRIPHQQHGHRQAEETSTEGHPENFLQLRQRRGDRVSKPGQQGQQCLGSWVAGWDVHTRSGLGARDAWSRGHKVTASWVCNTYGPQRDSLTGLSEVCIGWASCIDGLSSKLILLIRCMQKMSIPPLIAYFLTFI